MNDLDPLSADADGAPRKRRPAAAARAKGAPTDPAAEGDSSAPTPRGSEHRDADASRSQARTAGARWAQQAAADDDSDEDETEPRRQSPRKRQPSGRYERPLAPGEATSLNPEYIVYTGEPDDSAPGRTSRLRWSKGRRAPISDEEAANVAWRRAAARLNRAYKSPTREEKIKKGKLPPTLQQALERLPAKLPDWDARRESLHLNVPGRLAEYLTAYADMMGCSVSQLAELWIYEQVRANVRSPKEIRAAYDRMCEDTYRQERAQMNAAAAADDEDDYEED